LMALFTAAMTQSTPRSSFNRAQLLWLPVQAAATDSHVGLWNPNVQLCSRPYTCLSECETEWQRLTVQSLVM